MLKHVTKVTGILHKDVRRYSYKPHFTEKEADEHGAQGSHSQHMLDPDWNLSLLVTEATVLTTPHTALQECLKLCYRKGWGLPRCRAVHT